MSLLNENRLVENENVQKKWKSIYVLGGISTIIVLTGIILDIVVGSTLGGDLSTLPKTAIDRFVQFNGNWLIGLYNLDLLNIINQIILIPGYFALYSAHRKVNSAYATFALTLFLVGTTIFVTNNTALPMLELSRKFAAATTELQKTLLAAAGEAMLARGTHGTPGVFIGFMLPNIAGLIMSLVMLKGKIFGKVTSWLGIIGSILIMVYLVLVTFVAGVEKMAILFSMPGGLLLMAWMIMFTIRLFQLAKIKDSQINLDDNVPVSN